MNVSSNLKKLLKPSSVAVVGASPQLDKVGNIIVRNMMEGQFRLYPVNPNHQEISGLKCYPSVRSLPETVDVVILAISAHSTLEMVKECVKVGIPFVVSVAGGFSEIGETGKDIQMGITKAVKGTGTRVLGPNTMGILAPEDKVDMFFLPKERSPRPGPGKISIISQSGSICVGVYEVAEDAHVGLRACVGVGNKADLDENDFLNYFADDPETKCISMYIESFEDGKEFASSVRRVAVKKPVVAVKVGITPSGAKAASSHTGAIATASDALVTGIFKQMGVQRVADEQEMLDASKALANVGHIEGDRIAIIGSAGGFGVIATDYVASKTNGFGLHMAKLSEDTKRRLGEKIPYFATVDNPVDLTGVVTDDMYDDVLEIIQDDDNVDAILLNLLFQPPGMTVGVVDVAEKWAKSGKKPLVICCIGGNFPRPILRRLEEREIATYTSLRRAVFALRCLYDRGKFLERVYLEAKEPV